jgi:hypothetical protein
MPSIRGFLLSCCTAGLIYSQAPQKQLTARELFYAAAQVPAAAAKPSAARPPAKRSATPPKPVEIARADTKPPALRTAQSAPATAPMPASGAPLGLRYTVLKLADGRTPMEVSPDTVFHAGDRIRFNIQGSTAGYLYIINQGSSGTWKPMFPSAEIEDGNNHIEGWQVYTMPPKSRFAFDSTVGTENLFIIFSLQPEADLEGMIYSLQGKKKSAAPAAAIGTDAPVQSSKELITAANIPNTAIDRLRSAYSRDLIIEKVDPDTPGDKKETAVYVVNPTGSADSRVVADLHLVHQ